MAINFTGTAIPGATITGIGASAPGNGDLAAQVVKTTFDKVIGFKLRQEPMLRRFAEVRPVDVAHPGSSVDMFIQGSDLALATTPLSEYADPDSVALPAPAKVTLTLDEYGNHTVTSMRLREFSFSSIDPYQAELIARNLRDSLDKLVEGVVYGTTGGVSNGGFAKFHVPATGGGVAANAAPGSGNPGKLNSAAVRRLVAKFRGNNVMEFEDGNFMAIIHPDQAVDLREETDAAGWRQSHYQENANSFYWNGEVGVYEGVKFVESNRVPTSGTGASKVYKTLLLGKQGLAEGVVREASTVVTPQLDKFGRMFGLGWYFWGGWSIYREEAGAVLSTTASAV